MSSDEPNPSCWPTKIMNIKSVLIQNSLRFDLSIVLRLAVAATLFHYREIYYDVSIIMIQWKKELLIMSNFSLRKFIRNDCHIDLQCD